MGSKDTVVPTCNSREGSLVNRGGFLQLHQKSIKESFGIWNNVGRIYYSKCIVQESCKLDLSPALMMTFVFHDSEITSHKESS